MDSGFLSGSSQPEVPHAPEQIPATSETMASVPAVAEQRAPEARVESEVVLAQQVPVAAMVVPEPTDEQLAAPPTATAIATPPDKVAEGVEQILRDGLDEAVAAMPEDAKQRFWDKGREIGTIVADMVRHYKVEVKRVLKMLQDWLVSIPGVNKFFLEQEAKIKTDRILELERQRHEVPSAL